MGDRDAKFDEFVKPLMVQISALCKKHGIEFLATFDVTEDEDRGHAPYHQYTSCWLRPDGNPYLVSGLAAVYPKGWQELERVQDSDTEDRTSN